MVTVEDIMITEVVDRIISNNLADKIATEEKVFKYFEQAYPELAAQDSAYFFNDRIKAGIGIDQMQSNGVRQLTVNVRLFLAGSDDDRKEKTISDDTEEPIKLRQRPKLEKT